MSNLKKFLLIFTVAVMMICVFAACETKEETLCLCAISFASNGGSEVEDIMQNYGTSVSAPTEPTKEGHNFNGWYIDSELTQLYTFTTMPSEDLTLYAGWEIKTFTVTFNSHGASLISGDEVQIVNYNELPIEPIYEKQGYLCSWDKIIGNITSDITINVILYTIGLDFTEIDNGYSVSKGDATSSYVKIPKYYLNAPVTEIGSFTDYSNLTNIDIPDTVQHISNNAFSNCADISLIQLPNSLISIGSVAFSNVSGVIEFANHSIIETIDESAFRHYMGESLSLPNSVTSIADKAFYYCFNINLIHLPNSIISIGNYAFYYCTSLTQITIPNGVTNIGNYAFQGCNSLTQITIPENVISIGDYVFDGCIMDINVSENNINYKSIDGVLFNKEGTILIRDTKGINSVLPESVIIIEKGAYAESSISSIVIPSRIVSIGEYAFKKCSNLTSVVFEENSQLTSIDDAAFLLSFNINTLIFSDNITHIYGAFAVSGIKNINIPSSVTSIDYAFMYCYGIVRLSINNLIPPILAEDGFSNAPQLKIYVPAESVDAYKTASGWSQYESKIFAMI